MVTVAAVVALVADCPEILHAAFSHANNLTDAAMVAVPDKCPGITHANLGWCENLAGTAKAAAGTKQQLPNCTCVI